MTLICTKYLASPSSNYFREAKHGTASSGRCHGAEPELSRCRVWADAKIMRREWKSAVPAQQCHSEASEASVTTGRRHVTRQTTALLLSLLIVSSARSNRCGGKATAGGPHRRSAICAYCTLWFTSFVFLKSWITSCEMDSVLIHWMNYPTQGWHRISRLIWSQSTKSARDPSHHF